LDPLVFLEVEVDEEVKEADKNFLVDQVVAVMVPLVVIRALMVGQEHMGLVEAVVVRRDMQQLVVLVDLVL
jgi:hypothetical protein